MAPRPERQPGGARGRGPKPAVTPDQAPNSGEAAQPAGSPDGQEDADGSAGRAGRGGAGGRGAAARAGAGGAGAAGDAASGAGADAAGGRSSGTWAGADAAGSGAGAGAGAGAGGAGASAAGGAAAPGPAGTPGETAPPGAARVGRLERWRSRVLPRSLLGIASLILAFAVGAGFSGVVLYSYYQYHLNQTNDRVNTLVSGYKKQFANAEGDLSATAAAAKATIQAQLQAVQQLQSDPATLAKLVKQLAPSLYFVHTLDTAGQASVGTAFVISSSSSQSLLLTSYTTVAAATHSPGPAIYVQHGSTDTTVTVQSWDAPHDLALLVLPQGNLPPLNTAPSSPSPQPGERIFAVSGLGSAGASITEGSVVDVSSTGLAGDAAIGEAFQGGPIVNQSGQVLAVASRTYAPLGFTSTGVWFAPPVNAACAKVLQCPGGSLPGS